MTALSIPDLPPDVDVLRAALAYAAAGWFVLPIDPRTKHAGSVLGKRWPEQTSRDPQQIAAWFAGAGHGLALHVGRSGAVVFDVDQPDAIPEVLRVAIAACAPAHQSTRVDVPGRGHYVFAAEAGRFGNSLGELGPGWGEVRGHNGIIVAAPTPHEKAAEGGRYAWANGRVVPDLPADLATLLRPPGGALSPPDEPAARAWLDRLDRDDEPCGATAAVALQMPPAGRHDAMQERTLKLARLADQGHRGVWRALAGLRETFVIAVTPDRRGGSSEAHAEFMRGLSGAIGIVTADPTPAADRGCCRPELPAVDWPPATDDGLEPTAGAGDTTADAATAPDLRARMFARVYDRDRLDTIEPPTALIDGVLDVATLAMLAGKFGTYKTFVSLSWALSIATGVPWFGRDVVTRGPVLYVATEGASGLKQRVRAWEVANLDGERVPPDLFVTYNGVVNLASAEQFDIFAEIAAKVGPVGIVFDTLHKCIPGLDEQNSEDMSEPLYRANRLREELGATVLFDHHTGHSGERSRGSSALEDDIDTSWVIRLSGDQEDRSPENQRVMIHRKAKDREQLDEIPLLLRSVADTGSCVVEPAEADCRPGAEWLVTSALAQRLDDLGAPRRLTIKETKRYGEKAGLSKHSQSMWAGVARLRREPLPADEEADPGV